MHRLLTIITTLLMSLTAMAQRYPVTVSPVLLPPYTLNLSELTAQGSAKMMATLTVNDLTAVNLPVRLHFKLESAGITVENIPTSAVAPLFLNGGETQILTGADMAQYLRLDNLEFRGYSKDSYRQTGQLPGGLWKVTIEVRHFHTGRVLSNRGAQTLWVSIYDPPVLTAPRNNTEAPDNPSLPLVFSWQASKHTGGTVAVQYKLELWEMRMEGVPAQTVAASMTPIFETTTQVTSYTAIPTIMNLEPGMRYCWRVTVSDPSGQAQINKNGQSEVREFTYLHTCPAVDEVTAAVRNTQADFSWTPSPYHTHFRVEMFQEGGSSEVSDCYDSKFRLYDFPQGTTWRVRVRGECKGDLEADWSPWTDFSIDPPGTPPTNDECPDCGCDDGPAKREIENYELKELQPGDTIVNRTGRTRFIVLSAEATGDHIYSGQFYLWLELWKTKVRCDYTDLKVNTDGVILDGSWRSVHNDGLMVNPATVAENIQNIREGIANATFDNSISDTIKLGYAIQTIYKDENGRYIAILEDGSEHDLTQDLSTANKTMVEDSQGNKMVVTGDQQLMSAEQYHNTGKNNTLIKSDNERKDKQIAASGDVIFKPSGNQQYGFDAYDASTNNHPEIYPPLEGGSYRPAYKSVTQWQQDKVAADPMQGVTFRNQMGAPYATTSGDIILRGEPQPGETPVYAHVAETDSTTKVVGKLNLLTFEPREISVCLVPVNGATPPNTQTLEKELNKIFKPAVASVKVSTHSGITIDYADGSGFVHGGSGLLSVYSDDEKAAINALTDSDDDTYYMFLVNSVTKLDADGNRTIVSGYMPIGYQHGFIFEQFDVARTYAHELSHGAFALHHTFSDNSESFHANEGTTNNLMDYTEHGIALNHKQWRWMHENHGKGLFGFLADEEEGALVDKGTTLAIKFGKLSDDFKPGDNELSIEYSIDCLEKIAEEHKDVTKAFLWILKDEETVYTAALPLKNTNTVKWNGKSNQGEVETEIDDLSDFTIKIGVTIEYDYSIVNIIEWLFTQNVDFKLSSEKEKEWSVLKWEKDFEILQNKKMQQAKKDNYYGNKNKYEARLEKLGVYATETTPLEYLNEHLVAGDFLGKEIPSINIRFLYFLRNLEEKLGRKKEWAQNKREFTQYCDLAPNIQDYARMSNVGESLSDHATGFAFDFTKNENPWFTTDKNIQQDKFIQIVTGVKLLNNQLSAAEIKKASDDFLERIKGNDFDITEETQLETIYDNIAELSEKTSLLNDDKPTEYTESVKAAAKIIDGYAVKNDQDIMLDELETKKQNLLNDIESTNKKFKSLKDDLGKLKQLFDASKSGLFINYDMGNNDYEQLDEFIKDYEGKTDVIIKLLESIASLPTSSAIDWNNGITDLENDVKNISFDSDYQTYLNTFSKNFYKKIKILGSKNDIKEFPNKLREETFGVEGKIVVKDYRGGKLFENGFCSLDASLVEAITKTKVTLNNTEMNLLWGGSYYGQKDIMHFELRKAANSSDRPYQKAVHGINMDEIKGYLNSFNKKDGGEYAY